MVDFEKNQAKIEKQWLSSYNQLKKMKEEKNDSQQFQDALLILEIKVQRLLIAKNAHTSAVYNYNKVIEEFKSIMRLK